jgi:hypothetical protein
MPVTVTNETLNPADWNVTEQQAMYDELAVLLDIPQQVDLANLTDDELTAHLQTVYIEMKTRPTATISQLEAVAFGPSTIFNIQP